jgi:hypothetical protein
MEKEQKELIDKFLSIAQYTPRHFASNISAKLEVSEATVRKVKAGKQFDSGILLALVELCASEKKRMDEIKQRLSVI